VSTAGDLMGAASSLLREVAGAVTVTYAQGSNSKGSISAWRKNVVRASESPSGVLQARCDFVLLVSDLASGFSGTSPVRPGAGDTITVSGEAAWTVTPETGDGTVAVSDSVYVLRCTQQRKRGSV